MYICVFVHIYDFKQKQAENNGVKYAKRDLQKIVITSLQ